MRFWDSSAIVPLLISEFETEKSIKLLREDEQMLVWCFTPVECVSAYFRRHRKNDDESRSADFKRRLLELRSCWNEVQAIDLVRARAERLLALHDLRAADSLQLAAALVASEERPDRFPFVSFDERLALAASREGFSILS